MRSLVTAAYRRLSTWANALDSSEVWRTARLQPPRPQIARDLPAQPHDRLPLTQIIAQPVSIRAWGTEHGGGHLFASSQNSCRRIADASIHDARGTKAGEILEVGSIQEKGWQATKSR